MNALIDAIRREIRALWARQFGRVMKISSISYGPKGLLSVQVSSDDSDLECSWLASFESSAHAKGDRVLVLWVEDQAIIADVVRR